MSPTIQNSPKYPWLTRIGGSLVILLGGIFLVVVAFPYFSFNEVTYDRFWTERWWVLGHVIGGTVALTIGPFQFWERFRNKYMQLHRLLGKTYLISIAFSVICSFVMASTTALAINWQWSMSLFALGIMWILTSGMAYRMIRLGRIQQHKEWMIRSYVVTFAFVSFRILLVSGMSFGLGDFSEVAASMMWTSWAMGLAFTEVCLQWNKT